MVGLPVRLVSPRGELRNARGDIEIQWKKCPKHETWLQPEWEPFDHWKCSIYGCDFKRPAKMRSGIEKHIFRSMQAIAKLAEEATESEKKEYSKWWRG